MAYEWTDYSKTEQRRMSLAMQKRLMRAHLVSWINYWCIMEYIKPKGFVRLLDKMLMLERRK